MEIAAAIVGAVATAAATIAANKLMTLVGNRSCEAAVKEKAESIKYEVKCINALIIDAASKRLSVLQTECFEQLSCLACEIEDILDLFDAGKTKGFSDEIDKLEIKSLKTRDRIHTYLGIGEMIAPGTPDGAVEKRNRMLRYVEPGQGIVGGGAERPDELQGEIQDILDTPSLRGWLAKGPNFLPGTSQGAAVVPQELLDLLEDSNHRVWVVENFDCLLYLCLFRPNHDVNTKPLMRRWAAEGLVQGDKDAAKNLRFLIDKSIIRSIHTSNNGEVETCQSTTQMHACISQKSKSQNFVMVFDGAASITDLAVARRLSLHPKARVELEETHELPRLRTLAVFLDDDVSVDNYEAVFDFSRYKVLRVLDLKECAPLSEKHVKDIMSNHGQPLMKYLSINLGSIDEISSSIKNLNQLETLDLSGTETVAFSQEVLLLPKLKHLLGKFQFHLRESMTTHSGLREFLANKSKLETLEGFVTGSRYGFQDLMSFMKSLRKVKIWCKSDASQAKLDVLSSAITKFIHRGINESQCSRSLSIDFEACTRGFVNEIDPVNASTLGRVELCGKLSEFPPFVAGLSQVVELCLCSTGLSWVAIREGLKNVRGLKFLKLVEDNLGHFDVDIPEKEADHLRSIQRITIVSSLRLDMTIPDKALPLLVSLRILCQALDVSPATSGVNISHMKELEEIALHLGVDTAIRTEWEEAASVHPHKHVGVTEGP
ncbi:hypothetical protein CFC21_026883 [Triticum aestivum]|uniref:Disease resistance R13L4/SHOC-2-like LRR domain-containing protein n=2 Tax=Triticum aestivum TaxID=4565 RepID=A0A9R1EM88_WHEAT|nr:disease resistance protein RGA4-like [Triticum aestivum]KAF7012724.1 hypothetical protein CFC21_026883 [Triticum aestivum]